MDETAYRQFAELEQSHFWFIGRRQIFTHLLERELLGADGASERRILDVGCGTGGMLGPLSRFGEVTGIDTSPEAVAVCRERGFERVEVGDAYELPAADRSVDVITMFDTIEHVPDDARALAEAHRALRSGGLLFLSVPAYQFLYANNDRIAHHFRRYRARQLRARLRAAGFIPTQITYFNTLLFPAILPAVLTKKGLERLRDPGDTTNLTHEIPAPINRALAGIMSSERLLLERRSFPFGHSIIAIARAG